MKNDRKNWSHVTQTPKQSVTHYQHGHEAQLTAMVYKR